MYPWLDFLTYWNPAYTRLYFAWLKGVLIGLEASIGVRIHVYMSISIHIVIKNIYMLFVSLYKENVKYKEFFLPPVNHL